MSVLLLRIPTPAPYFHPPFLIYQIPLPPNPSFENRGLGGPSYGRYYFGRYSSELAQLVSLPSPRGTSTRYSDRLCDFSVNIPRWSKDIYVNRSFPCTARLWNSLPIECFPLNYDLSGLKSRINRHLNFRFFLNRLPVCFNLFVLLFLVTPCFAVAVQPCR